MTAKEKVNAVAAHAKDIIELSAKSDIRKTLETLQAEKIIGKEEFRIFSSDDMEPFAKRFFQTGLALGVILASYSIVGKAAEVEGVQMPDF